MERSDWRSCLDHSRLAWSGWPCSSTSARVRHSRHRRQARGPRLHRGRWKQTRPRPCHL